MAIRLEHVKSYLGMRHSDPLRFGRRTAVFTRLIIPSFFSFLATEVSSFMKRMITES